MVFLKVLFLSKFILIANGLQVSIGKEKYEEALVRFESFISDYNKTYDTPEEKAKRLGIFMENLEIIKDLNEKNPHTIHGVNIFADLSSEEFLKHHLGARLEPGYDGCTQVTSPRGRDAPEELDWRTQGVVSPVKYQDTCGSCWAFSVTGVVESKYAMKYGEILDLSEQEILDCVTENAYGCQGGNPPSAFAKLVEIGGQTSEVDYPYENKQGSCRFDASKAAAKLSQCTIYNMSEDDLKQVVYEDGPVSVIMEASILQTYNGAVFTCSTSKNELHAVVIVGYGTENGLPYWLIKNSWGTSFGDQGYFKLKRGTNECLVGNPGTISSGDIA